MKKFFISIFLLVGMTFSTFALSAGVRLNGGGNVGNNLPNASMGIGAYLNLDLIAGFGLQFEVNAITREVFKDGATNELVFRDYTAVDIPAMLWYNFNLPRFTIGGGAGLNFSYVETKRFKDIKYEVFQAGVACGLNAKFFFNRNIGLVLGATGIFDVIPIKQTSSNNETRFSLNTNCKRASIFGSIGVEFNFR